MDAEFWRSHALDGLMPLWHAHSPDAKHGGFHLNLSRSWEPQPPWDKVPAMISRQVFAFTAAYLLSGDDKYLDTAREGTRYLLQHAWDPKYGGWYDELTQTGQPLKTSKSTPLQLYTNVGLTLYVFATGDEEVLSRIRRSVEILSADGRDEIYGGFYGALHRDLSVLDPGKNKHAHYGYVGSLLLNLSLTTRDPAILKLEREMTDLTLERMTDQEGWVFGFGSRFDRQWQRTPKLIDRRPVISVGAQLTAALSFLRLHRQTGDPRYLERGRALADLLHRYGWDAERGCWFDWIEYAPPHRPIAAASVSWWIQIYGAFLQLQLYGLTGEESCLARFRRTESFFLTQMIDREFGGVYATVSPEGKPLGNTGKAHAWRTAYHEIEHALLNYLLLRLYVDQKPAVLHFRLDRGTGERRHYVSLLDDPQVTIAKVTVNGQAWERFDASERSIVLPAGAGLRVEVTLAPADGGKPTGSPASPLP